MKEKIIYFYDYNAGRGYIGLYFTKKEIRLLKREYNITENDSLKDAYNKVINT